MGVNAIEGSNFCVSHLTHDTIIIIGSGCKGEKRDLCPSMCFFLSLVTVPEVFAKVNSAQVLSRF